MRLDKFGLTWGRRR